MKLLRRYKDLWTEGKILFPDGTHIYCTERPWENNKPNISCIPEGTYIVDRDKKGRHQFYKIREGQIKNRTNIEIHAGNDPKIHSQGCILPCMIIENGIGKSSKHACDVILGWYMDNSFIIEIKKWHPRRDGKW